MSVFFCTVTNIVGSLKNWHIQDTRGSQLVEKVIEYYNKNSRVIIWIVKIYHIKWLGGQTCWKNSKRYLQIRHRDGSIFAGDAAIEDEISQNRGPQSLRSTIHHTITDSRPILSPQIPTGLPFPNRRHTTCPSPTYVTRLQITFFYLLSLFYRNLSLSLSLSLSHFLRNSRGASDARYADGPTTDLDRLRPGLPDESI